MKLLLIKSPGILPHPARQQCLAGSPGAGAMSAALRGAGNTLTLGLVAPPPVQGAGSLAWDMTMGRPWAPDSPSLAAPVPYSRGICVLFVPHGPRDSGGGRPSPAPHWLCTHLCKPQLPRLCRGHSRRLMGSGGRYCCTPSPDLLVHRVTGRGPARPLGATLSPSERSER